MFHEALKPFKNQWFEALQRLGQNINLRKNLKVD